MQIQNCDLDEVINKIWDLFDQVPAQVKLLNVTQLLDALWHRDNLFEIEVQTPFTILRQHYVVLSRFQGDCLPFRLFAFLSFGHVAATAAAAGRQSGH